MKTTRFLTCQLAASLALSLLSAGQQEPQATPETGTVPAKPVMRDAATHDDLVIRTRQIEQEKIQPVFTPMENDPAKAYQPQDLISRSDILCFNGIATLVPKRAVIHVPKNMASRIGMQDGAKIVTWPDFLAANRNWVTTSPVSRPQAEGQMPLSEATVKSFEKESRLVVAVYEECPISVLPVQAPEANPNAASK
ncbi:hypothetical protein [Luteolibacter luteus]|uniref:Uncharacterized protein n=1 Tax=Luteolibacter luteus TaxID=2728835 RepID=A0A858RNZ0_9BACT|nr:hypothetical protein [Luteolibacter luteus]QJE97653.1 hypothetical protein HHL09_18335 [Luteolibacter luteus]